MPSPRCLAWALALLLGPSVGFAQGPDADWRTLETEHFRVHFPAELEAWAATQAARLESIRAAVSAEVGYAPPQIVDVVISDPQAQANGSAWALLGRPRLLLWATPPSASSGLGQLTDWGELVTVHEVAHLAHLLRPSRDPLRSLAERTVLPVGPLALGAPRWVIEGYATLVEGRLTGSGRPHSALRAAVLRQWARQGRLPSYGRLSSDRDRFLGMSMAYLAGSAYLEWLERRVGDPEALPKLWAAASARGRRSFDEAFERVFADRADALWNRFVVESAAAALDRERRLSGLVREGELWLDREGGASSLQVSPDGRRIAALLFDSRRPARLVVWDLDRTAPAPPGPDTALDPDDPPAAPRAPREREPLAELEAAAGTRLVGARFLPDAETLLVGQLVPDTRGDLHAELAEWRPKGGLRRLTKGADVRDADPLPGGRLAAAVRWRQGRSGLVLVALDTGRVTELTAPALDRIHDRPRVAPDGRSLAWLEHRYGVWSARLASLDAEGTLGPARELAPAAAGEPIDLAWRGDGSLLYAAVARADELDIEALSVGREALSHRVTRSVGAALAPAPTPDGTLLYFLSLDADGLDLRRLELDAATIQTKSTGGATGPGRDESSARSARFPSSPVAPSRPYGAGRPETTILLGGFGGSGSGALEAGMRVGDLLGRWETVALGGFGGEDATRGAALRFAARPWPATLWLHLARLRDESGELDALELGATRTFVLSGSRLGILGGVGYARDPVNGRDRTAGFVGLELSSSLVRGRAILQPGLELDANRSWAGARSRYSRATAGLTAAVDDWSARFEVERREARRVEEPYERLRLGGAPSSLAPDSARPGRIDHPALPPLVAFGERYEATRLRLSGASPFGILGEQHRLDHGPWLRLVGADLRWTLSPTPLVGLPALRLEAGAARVEGGSLRRHTRWWTSLTFPMRPAEVDLPAISRRFATRSPRR